MLEIQMWSLLLVLCAGSSQAWFFNLNPDPTTEVPAATTQEDATTVVDETAGEAKDGDNLSNLGEEILSVATGIRKFVEDWSATTTAWTASEGPTPKVEGAHPNMTDQSGRLRGERLGEGEGSRLVSRINRTSVSPCLPVPSHWSICKWPNSFSLPNFFNHTSVEEVGAVLQEWAWLVRAGCHHSTEWFLCLLLVPRCAPPAAPFDLPCRSFCSVLQDSCWASLENGRLPVECHHLPEREQEPERPACASVSNRKGNPAGLECIGCEGYIWNPVTSCLPLSVRLFVLLFSLFWMFVCNMFLKSKNPFAYITHNATAACQPSGGRRCRLATLNPTYLVTPHTYFMSMF
nr:uncharacterized protein LOC129165166 [Nothobranchius furzeri]